MKTWIFLMIVIVPHLISAQNVAQLNLRTHYTGYQIGASYPYYTIKSDNYSIQNRKVNMGFLAGFEWGRVYRSGISYSFSPSMLFTSFGKVNYRFEVKREPGEILASYRDGYRRYRYFSFTIPVLFEVPLSGKVWLGLGGYVMKPLAGSGRDVSEGYNYLSYPHIKHLIPQRIRIDSHFEDIGREEYAGLITKLSLPVTMKDDTKWVISLTYLHALTWDYSYHSFENWLILSYSRRNFKTKEIREKWDKF